MTTHDSPADMAADACSVCGAAMPPGAQRCEACGATRGEEHKCPFCGVVAQPQPHPSLRFVCPACGAPRIPPAPGVNASAASGKALGTALSTARSARSSGAIWKLAAGLSMAFGALSALLLVGVSLIASPALFPLVAGALVAATPLVFAAVAWHKAARRNEQLEQSLDEAWVHAAGDLVEAKGTVRTRQLAEAFGIDEGLAGDLLARLAARSEITTDVTDDGELALSMRSPDRLRIQPPMRVEAEPEPPAEPAEVAVEATADDRGAPTKANR